jgi:hypothetical protein
MTNFHRRCISCLVVLTAVLAVGCSLDTERKRWGAWMSETKEDLKTATGSHEYTGFSSRSREIEKSINQHYQ